VFDTIEFNLSTTPNFIAPLTALPAIADPALIDGTTQPGYTNAPLIEIDGYNTNIAQSGSGGARLQIMVGGTTVRGLSFLRWEGDGIVLDTADGNTIAGNYFGLRTKAIGRFKFTHLGRHGPGERRGVSPTWIRVLPSSGATTSGLRLDARLAAAWVNLFLPLA